MADGAKSEQAHHCAGMERELARPRLTMSEETSAWSAAPCPSESKGHRRNLSVDSERAKSLPSWERPVFLKPGQTGNVGHRWEAVGSGHHACFSFHIVLVEK